MIYQKKNNSEERMIGEWGLKTFSPLQLGKIGEKIYKFLNFGQMSFGPPENWNRKVPLSKGGASPPNAPPKLKIKIPKTAEKITNIL